MAMQSLYISYIIVMHAKQNLFQAEVGVQFISPSEQNINCKNFHGP